MAAFLKIRPGHGALTAAETILRRQACGRPTLVCHWQQDAHGRLSCHWDIERPDRPVPPH
jgi:hypothetical protein